MVWHGSDTPTTPEGATMPRAQPDAHEFWQPDPTGRHEKRWRRKDGTWTDQVSDGGTVGSDPYDGPQPEAGQPGPEQSAAAAPAAPLAVSQPARREPLGFWQTTIAVAVGVLIAAVVGLAT